MDTLACGFQALKYPACTRVAGTGGARRHHARRSRVPGTSYELDPVMGAFSIGAMVRWLDFNDTWLAAEWGHPSDNLGAILAVADYLSRRAILLGEKPLTVRDVLDRHDQGARDPGRAGAGEQLQPRRASITCCWCAWPRPRWPRRCSAARSSRSSTRCRTRWIDGGALRTYRHAPNTGSRKSWAAGDATSRARAPRAVRAEGRDGLSVGAERAKPGASRTCCSRASRSRCAQPLGSYVMENVLFKISFPAEFHAQTAVECAMALHPQVKDRLALDRAHRHRDAGTGRAHHRQDRSARESRRSRSLHPVHGGGAADLRPPHRRGLRGRRSPAIRASTCCAARWKCARTPTFTQEYYERDKRHIGNALHIFFSDGSRSSRCASTFRSAIASARGGHAVAGAEVRSFRGRALSRQDRPKPSRRCSRAGIFDSVPVNEFMAALVAN